VVRALVLAPVVLALACSGGAVREAHLAPEHDVTQALAVCDELERARAFDAARRQLEAVAAFVPASQGTELRLRGCALWSEAGQGALAADCYRALAAAPTPPAEAATAAYRGAALRWVEGDERGATVQLWAVITRWPTEVAAARSLRLLRGRARERGGLGAELAILQTAAAKLEGEADALLVIECWTELARLSLEDAHPDRALAAAQQARARAAGTTWLDDALYWQARAEAALGRGSVAVGTYDELRRSRRTSWFVGSYQSAFYARALLEGAELLVTLERRRQAEDWLDELIANAPDSALVPLAKARRLALGTTP